VITPGFRLPNAWIIHCLGPVYGIDEPAADLLASCYRGALALADDHALESVAFPALSTGIFGYPVDEAAPVALEAVIDAATGLRSVRRVRFVLFDTAVADLHRQVLERLRASRPPDADG
jgi:O-acetyl-ADP-ribose deacetylase (regulator of RNase III)